MPELQEQFRVVCGEGCIVLRGGEARQNELSEDALELSEKEIRSGLRGLERHRPVGDDAKYCFAVARRDLVGRVAKETLERGESHGSERV